MPHSEDVWTADTALNDAEIFISPQQVKDLSASLPGYSAGLLNYGIGASAAISFYANVPAVLKRTGISGVDAEGITGFPPFMGANLITLKGPRLVPIAKGMQINSMDLLYTVIGSALSAITVSLLALTYTDQQAYVQTNLIALGQNGLPLTVTPIGTTAVSRKNIPVTNPAMLISPGTDIQFYTKITTGAGTAKFYGAVLKCSYNFA